MAFRLSAYQSLLRYLKDNQFALLAVREYFLLSRSRVVYLRHDVDRFVSRAVDMARVEAAVGAVATYYFRCSAQGVFPEQAIREVLALGHEVGYHYETMARSNGNPAEAEKKFIEELAILRSIAPVRTIAAHGSPLSAFSNMGYGSTLDLRSLDILGEPSTDFDFSKVLYATDTGGAFGSPYNVRDRVDGRNLTQIYSPQSLGHRIVSENELMVLLNCHPERWASGLAGLAQAAATDTVVNVLKASLRKLRGQALQEDPPACAHKEENLVQ